MAVKFDASNEALKRTSGLVADSSDYSCIILTKPTSTPAAFQYKNIFLLVNGIGTYTKWVEIYQDDSGILLSVENGGGEVHTSHVQIANDYHVIWYKRSGNDHSLYVDGVLIGTVTSNITAAGLTECYIGDDTFQTTFGYEVEYFKEWNTVLTVAEFIADSNSPTVVKSANNQTATPLVSDLLDTSGNGHTWTAVGSTSFVSGPLPVPATNITALTAQDLGNLSGTFIQLANDSGGTTGTFWYLFTSTFDGVIGLLGFGDVTNYKPRSNVFLGPAAAPVQSIVVESIQERNQIPVANGITYYIRYRVLANAAPALLKVQGDVFSSTLPAPVGSIIVNDDTPGYGLTISDRTDGHIIDIIPFPAGEQGQVLLDGTVCVEDVVDRASDIVTVKFYDNQYNLLATDSFTSGDGWQRTFINGNKTDRFYLGFDADFDHFAGVPSFRILSSAGATIQTWTALGGSGLTCLAVSNDGNTLYYGGRNGSNNRPIKAWNISGGSQLSDFAPDFVSGGLHYSPKDIVVLGNDNVVVGYVNASENFIIVVYDPIGNQLAAYNQGTQDARLNYDPASSAVFWYWSKPKTAGVLNGTSTFYKVDPTDGSFLETVVSELLINKGHSTGVVSSIDSVFDLFGPSFSCPFWLTTVEFPPTASTGTIIVVKVTVPDSITDGFTFTAGGGLSPATFELAGGESITFSSVPIGSGYSILEDIVAEFSTTYVVSNGSPIDNISVANGETVTVTVTNSKQPATLSGIYQIVPDKTNDTLWASFAPDTTLDVKIPDPFIDTALVGN